MAAAKVSNRLGQNIRRNLTPGEKKKKTSQIRKWFLSADFARPLNGSVMPGACRNVGFRKGGRVAKNKVKLSEINACSSCIIKKRKRIEKERKGQEKPEGIAQRGSTHLHLYACRLAR